MNKPKRNRQGEGGAEALKALEAFAIRLRETRAKRGMTQQEVAAAIGLASYNSYQYWERAQRWPSTEYLAPLCLALGVKADYILGLADEK